mmetsp:Transcript_24949/g.63285  ORF Transcript_24949/g.63285 Transcript_24949/m.63285 type:complete len:210 (+) Transcript_24949:230-859(+)
MEAWRHCQLRWLLQWKRCPWLPSRSCSASAASALAKSWCCPASPNCCTRCARQRWTVTRSVRGCSTLHSWSSHSGPQTLTRRCQSGSTPTRHHQLPASPTGCSTCLKQPPARRPWSMWPWPPSCTLCWLCARQQRTCLRPPQPPLQWKVARHHRAGRLRLCTRVLWLRQRTWPQRRCRCWWLRRLRQPCQGLKSLPTATAGSCWTLLRS